MPKQTIKNNKITVDLAKVTELAVEGGKFIYTPKAEQALVNLLTLKELVDKSIDLAKEMIAEAGTQLDPNFKGVVGEQVKSIYRTYGEKYYYDGHFDTPKEVLKTITTVKVDGKGVETYVKEHGALPVGIQEKERTPVLSLTLIEHGTNPRAIEED